MIKILLKRKIHALHGLLHLFGDFHYCTLPDFLSLDLPSI